MILDWSRGLVTLSQSYLNTKRETRRVVKSRTMYLVPKISWLTERHGFLETDSVWESKGIEKKRLNNWGSTRVNEPVTLVTDQDLDGIRKTRPEKRPLLVAIKSGHDTEWRDLTMLIIPSKSRYLIVYYIQKEGKRLKNIKFFYITCVTWKKNFKGTIWWLENDKNPFCDFNVNGKFFSNNSTLVYI